MPNTTGAANGAPKNSLEALLTKHQPTPDIEIAQGSTTAPVDVEAGGGDGSGAQPGRQQQDGKIRLQVGGVDREFSPEQLAGMVVEGETLTSQRAALDEAMKGLTSRSAILGALERLTPEQRASVEALFTDPNRLAAAVGGGNVATESVDDEIEALLGPGNTTKSASAIRAMLDELAQIRPLVHALASRENTRVEQEREQTWKRQVEAQLDSFSVFRREDPQAKTARALVSERILSEVARTGGQTDVSKLAARLAGDAMKMLSSDTAAPTPPPRRQPSGSYDEVATAIRPKSAPTGDDIMRPGGLAANLIRSLGIRG